MTGIRFSSGRALSSAINTNATPLCHVQIENDEVRALPVQGDARRLDVRGRAYVMPRPAKDIAQDVPVIGLVFHDKHICHAVTSQWQSAPPTSAAAPVSDTNCHE